MENFDIQPNSIVAFVLLLIVCSSIVIFSSLNPLLRDIVIFGSMCLLSGLAIWMQSQHPSSSSRRSPADAVLAAIEDPAASAEAASSPRPAPSADASSPVEASALLPEATASSTPIELSSKKAVSIPSTEMDATSSEATTLII